MRDSVLVTLADKNFIDQAKQLFSSAYWNGGWQGDYLLLAHEIPEEDLRWFRKKGILVFPCTALTEKDRAGEWHSPVVLDKFYLFTPSFKQWRHVIFLDADIIVRASLKRLTAVKGFAAPNAHATPLRWEFVKRTAENRRRFKELEQQYPLKGRAFNSGIMAFSSDVIGERSFEELLDLYRRYDGLNRYGEEATFNLFFYRNWELLSLLFNIYPYYTHQFYGIPYEKIQGIILHFVRETTSKPWLDTSPFHDEWLASFRKADAIDLGTPQEATELWATEEDEKDYLRSLAARKIIGFYRRVFASLNWFVGQIGLLVKRLSPSLYAKIRINKNIPL